MKDRTLVVDLCGTLVKTNTTHGFLLCPEMTFIRRLAARCLLSRLLNAILSRLPGDVQRRSLICLLTGLSRNELQSIARCYASSTLQSLPRDDVVDRVRSHKLTGGKLYIASASLDVVVGAFAELLEADGYVATELRYDGVVCEGAIDHDSTGKKLAALCSLPQFDPQCFDVITDNPEDTDLMGAAEKTWFIDTYD